MLFRGSPQAVLLSEACQAGHRSGNCQLGSRVRHPGHEQAGVGWQVAVDLLATAAIREVLHPVASERLRRAAGRDPRVAGEIPMYHHILIPTDGSPLSASAVEKGVALAKTLGAKVTVLTVVEPFPVL